MDKKLVTLLRSLVENKSVFPEEKKMSDYLYDFFKKRGFNTVRQMVEKGRENILVERGTGEKSILLYSHIDTVGVSEGWKSNPFKLKIVGDKAYGLGAWDMKAGMAANIQAFLDTEPKGYRLKMVFCIDEENISKGGHKLAKSDFIKDAECIISCEPSFFHGNNGVVIGRTGRAVFTLSMKAQPKHYALYEPEYDMGFFASDLIKELGKLYRKYSDRKQFVFARTISSKSLGISTPMTIEMELDSSVIPPYTSDDILKKIRKAVSKLEIQYGKIFKTDVAFKKRETPFLESYEIDKKDKRLKALSGSIKRITGKKAIAYFRSSVADENIFGAMGKTVFGIGPVGGNAHSPNEWVSIKSTTTLYKIIMDFLKTSEILPEK